MKSIEKILKSIFIVLVFVLISAQDGCEDYEYPFGEFGTPKDGSVVSGSIAVSGWALDDTGVESVKIYREQGKELIYIGDAVFVEGARPDIEEAYPDYPQNYLAGWGYMLLTNFLPNKGNGTFVLHAIATDFAAKSTDLGTKTIICDNAHAVKPFGAIDTPEQGGYASGDSFVNWGWVLTPQPNSIPIDGSTVNVWVDGVNIGHPNYNIYRDDIAKLFPGYANTDGAVGYFYLNTTKYANGVHTIQWTATDTGGNTDGIGSRYFTIENYSSSGSQITRTQYIGLNLNSIEENSVDYSTPIEFKVGVGKCEESKIKTPDEDGLTRLEMQELDRLEVKLSNTAVDIQGYVVVGTQLKPIPKGSTIDVEKGTFCWLAGPGYIGEYHLVFLEKDLNGNMLSKHLTVNIVSKF
jgi:hypothetical protein